jgi:leucyl-tRNA synthetase
VDRHAERFVKEPRGDMPAALPEEAQALRRKVHQTILKVTSDIEERIHLNTAVAALNELYNEIDRREAAVSEGPGRAALREAVETLVLLLAPFTPHVCEEMGERLNLPRPAQGLARAAWPVADPAVAREENVELAVQVNGKVRGRIVVPRDANDDLVRRLALAEPRVKELVDGKQVKKLVVVPGRLVSLVVR